MGRPQEATLIKAEQFRAATPRHVGRQGALGCPVSFRLSCVNSNRL
ncbi:hypothetical protein D918_09845 [Trichuris suis]|nr:hypothetical protein D918_09845 [Trichuris suis]